jgi:hypothetical protein
VALTWVLPAGTALIKPKLPLPACRCQRQRRWSAQQQQGRLWQRCVGSMPECNIKITQRDLQNQLQSQLFNYLRVTSLPQLPPQPEHWPPLLIHEVEPWQPLPAPAVHPKQWLSTAMRSPAGRPGRQPSSAALIRGVCRGVLCCAAALHI